MSNVDKKGIFGWYTRQIDSGFGVHRWIEYAFSASTMTGVFFIFLYLRKKKKNIKIFFNLTLKLKNKWKGVLALAVGFRDVFTVALLIGNLLVTQVSFYCFWKFSRYLDFSLNTKCRKELNDRQRFILHGVINTLFPKKKNLNFFKKTLIFKVPYAFAWTPILYQYYSVVTSGNGDVYR